MTAHAPAGGHGLRHEAAVYGSDDELMALAVPFLAQAMAAGEPAVVSLARHEQDLVLGALDSVEGVTAVAHEEAYANPFVALDTHRRTLGRLLGDGAPRVRLLGQTPAPVEHGAWRDWARYEAAMNHLYGALDVWTVCPYDARTTPDHVLEDVSRTHPHLALPGGGREPSTDYTDPAELLDRRAREEADPLEATAPHAAMRNPTPAHARRMVTALAAEATVDAAATSRLVLAVSEVVTNGLAYGAEPVDVMGWAAADRVVVIVRDHGPGPGDPFIGFLPRRDGPGGLGLWLSHQACRMALLAEPGCFTVRLTAGTPPH